MKELCEPHLKNQIDAFKKGDSSFQREIIYCDDFDFKILIALYFSNLERSEMEQDVKCQNWIWSLGLTEKKPSKGLKFFIDLLSDKFPLNENGESGTIGSLKLDEIDNKTFFENLNMAYNEGVLKSIKTFVIGADNHEQSSESFSEGEQQMLIIKALNKIFDGENCLFLFDEPDTFLHPKWQGEFIQHLEENNRNSQYIITSHSPFIAAALKKEQLYVMKKEEDKIIVNHPMNHPYGKTVDEILIDAFGLSSLRSVEAQSEINQIWDLIKSEKTDNEEFKRKLEELEKSIGKDNRAITSIKIELLKRQKLKNA
jgi:ABC-type cobalamin/Fe3+-siderophores transport system ATPase subunit